LAIIAAAVKARPPELPGVVGRPMEALGANADGLKALGRLRELVHGPWPEGVRVEEVKAGIDAYAETASPEETAVMRRYLALRSDMEGQPDVRRKLLQPGETRDAQSVLRDLKALAETSTPPPARNPLWEMPLPEPEPGGLKGPVLEAVDKDLPGLAKELPDAEPRARRGAQRAIETSAAAHWHHFVIHLRNLKSATTVSDPDDREDEVERKLGHPLEPKERLLARRLLRTKKPAEVAAALRSIEKQ
jgi:hypothetical protein